ncbi:MAG: DUF3488 domain-containing protein, partial [Chloroflexi bacterium]|nr:DUF3488 domain-containing protein [Chloroflexota bacterium]
MRISLPWPFRRRAPKARVSEESLPFRLAILAASLSAAAGLAWATGLLFPVLFGSVALALGHRFSWRNRHRNTGRVRGLLLLVLFLAIFWMLADLTVGVTGGVLPQAQFALYAQAITSFDLRTRRNLYTTSMHSLLITYVASAYGFDLIYGIFVLAYAGCFLAALAIAYLEDDAKSATGWQLRQAATSRLWTSVALFSLPCTVVFFLILPRSEGAALIMPAMVSLQLPASLRGEIAPPIFPFIEVSSGGSTGASPRMEIQTRGRFNQQAVMYVRSQIGSYWRGLALDRYDGASWETRIQRRDLRRSAGGGFDVPRLSGSATAQEYTQTFYIVQPQPNVVFS